MAETFTGISLNDIKDARRDVLDQKLAHGALMSSHPHAQWIDSIPREAAKAFAQTERLRVRGDILAELGRQGERLSLNATAPVFHPDVLSSEFDPEIARGEVMPVVVPFKQTESGLEVPLYTIDAIRGTAGTPLGELVEEADPEHNPVERVMKVVKGEADRVLERMGKDPEVTGIQVVKASALRDIFDAGALSPRTTVTSTPAVLEGHMVTVGRDYIGSHPANENSIPTKLVITKKLQAVR